MPHPIHCKSLKPFTPRSRVALTVLKSVLLTPDFEPFYYTPYNRLLRRQITALTTDQGKFCRKGVSEVFVFAKLNKRICGLQLMIENIFNVWRYYSSNLTLFQVQISFLSARTKNSFLFQPNIYETKHIIFTGSH